MRQQPIADLYSAYLRASFGATTATGLSERREGEVSPDQVSRYWAGTQNTASDRGRTVKALVRDVQAEAGVVLLDDSIEEKPYTDENDIVGGHSAHAKDRRLKGITFLTALDSSQGVRGPGGFPWGAKTAMDIAPQTQKAKRRSPVATNLVGHELSKQAVRNRLPFRFVLFAVGVASAETLVFIKPPPRHDFLCPLKTTRNGALSQADTQPGRYVRGDTLELQAQAPRESYLERGAFPLVLGKQVFPNEDGSGGMRSLLSRDTPLSFHDVTTTSHKRGGACYPKSLQQNVAFAKSPTPTVTPQTPHFFAALGGLIQLERLKMKTQLHHFALKSKRYLNALHSAFSTLPQLTSLPNPA